MAGQKFYYYALLAFWLATSASTAIANSLAPEKEADHIIVEINSWRIHSVHSYPSNQTPNEAGVHIFAVGVLRGGKAIRMTAELIFLETNEVPEAKKSWDQKHIKLYFKHWQLPGILSLLQRATATGSLVYCDVNHLKTGQVTARCQMDESIKLPRRKRS